MTATYIPSNFLLPDPKYGVNANWTQSETSAPQSSTFIEDIPNRVMVVTGRHSAYFESSKPNPTYYFTADSVNNELTATFRFTNAFVQECTGFQLEQAVLLLPAQTAPASRNLIENSCGDYVDNSLATPKRFVFSECDMQVPMTVAGQSYTFSMSSYLPYGRNIAYYSIADLLGYVISGVTDFMKTNMGDTNFTSFIYVDNVGPRLYWRSPKYGLNSIRFLLRHITGAHSTFWDILSNSIVFADMRVGDTTGQTGYTGESMAFYSKPDTGFQNNNSFMTIHCKELTQFRKSDNIAPTEGSSLIGICTNNFLPIGIFDNTYNPDRRFILSNNTLTSPKIAFDRTQVVTELEVTLRVANTSISQEIKFSPTEVESVQATLIFRLW